MPRAFPGWLKRIVFKHCDRLTRGKRLPTVALDEAVSASSGAADPSSAAARSEMAEKVRAAIAALPKRERTVAALFYVNGYSRRTIAEFLEVPVTTIDNRLHAARKRLREKIAGKDVDQDIADRIAENMDAADW